MSSPGNQWIYQKTCALCRTALGFGQHRQRKLYCKVCRRAICPLCALEPASSPSKESICRQCGAIPAESDLNQAGKAERRLNSVQIARAKPLFGLEKYEAELGEVKRTAEVDRSGLEGVETTLKRIARRNSELSARISALEQAFTQLDKPQSADISQVPSKGESCLHCAPF